MDKISEFKNEYRFLSNFWMDETTSIEFEGMIYPSTEHAYQAAKSLDQNFRKKVASAPDPGSAKSLGKHVDLRADWNRVRLNVMKEILDKKFSNPILREKLLATEDAILEEGNWWGDRFWGVSPANSGNGKNWLGFLLMELRNKLRKEEKNVH